jgi:RNA polymerase sigma-70 factor (ECF subfamily)
MPGLTVEKVQQAMEQLPEGYRVVFSLYLLEGYDHAEISQIMGISEATSKSQYSRAKQRIKEILQNQYYERQV